MACKVEYRQNRPCTFEKLEVPNPEQAFSWMTPSNEQIPGIVCRGGWGHWGEGEGSLMRGRVELRVKQMGWIEAKEGCGSGWGGEVLTHSMVRPACEDEFVHITFGNKIGTAPLSPKRMYKNSFPA